MLPRSKKLLYGGFLLLTSFAAFSAGETFQNPIAPDGADPWVVFRDGFYYYCRSAFGSVWVNRAATPQEVLTGEAQPVWTPLSGQPWSQELWAPELHFLQGRWYIYVAADDGRNETHRMYVLESETKDALGAYRFVGKISDPADKWAIDGTVLVLDDNLYFLWSGWEGDTNVQQNLYIAPMKDPKTIAGPRTLISQPEFNWERIGQPYVNEGPEVLQRDGKTFIIYSASGSWTDHYCLGQLTLLGSDPLAPGAWEKKKTPVFGSTATVFAPGHASFIQSPDGKEDWIIYHAAKHKGAGWNRNVRMQPFTWDLQGHPVFGYPLSEGIPLPLPSQ